MRCCLIPWSWRMLYWVQDSRHALELIASNSTTPRQIRLTTKSRRERMDDAELYLTWRIVRGRNAAR